LKKGEIRLSPGKYVTVEAPGSVLKDAIVNMEHPGPSPVLFNILELMLSAATDITGVKDILTGETGGKTVQPTTILAMIEQGLKVFTAIYKRIYRALKQEFKLLFYLNAKFLPDQQYFTVLDSQQAIAKADYDWQSIDVMPVADPRMVTDMQKMGRAQFLQTFLGSGLINDQEALMRIFDAVGMENPQALIPQGMSPAQELQMKNAAVEIDGKMADMEKKQAETEKIKQEIQLEPIRMQLEQKNAESERQDKREEMQAGREDKRAELAINTQLKGRELEDKREERNQKVMVEGAKLDQKERTDQRGTIIQLDQSLSDRINENAKTNTAQVGELGKAMIQAATKSAQAMEKAASTFGQAADKMAAAIKAPRKLVRKDGEVRSESA
jgi:hypothetical protein